MPEIREIGLTRGVDKQRQVGFPASYIEECFLIWYKHGRPAMAEVIKFIPPEELSGDTVRYQTLNVWAKHFAWYERADVLDAEVSRLVEIQAINEKVQMLQRQAKLGEMLQDKGKEYFDTHVIDNDRTALGAIKTGVEIERNARGIPDALMKIAEMRDEELGDVVSKLLAKINPDEALKFTGVINITEKPDTVDAEFKEEETEEVVDDGGQQTTEQTE